MKLYCVNTTGCTLAIRLYAHATSARLARAVGREAGAGRGGGGEGGGVANSIKSEIRTTDMFALVNVHAASYCT